MNQDRTSMRHVLILRPTMGEGGADRVTLTLLQELPRDCFRISLALMRREGPLLGDVPEDVKLYELGSRSLWTTWLPLWRLLSRQHFDVLFSTSGGFNIATVLAASLARYRHRIVLSERGLLGRGRNRFKKSVQRLLKRLLYPRANLVAVVSRGVKEDLIDRLHLREESVAVVHNPVVTDKIFREAAEPLDHPWFDGSTPVLLAVGRLIEEKDYPTLLRAFAKVRSSISARLVILGDGPLRGGLQRRIDALEVGADVELAGFDPNPFRYMSRCTIYVLSSRFEGLPGALIQAMACGAPVVATDCPGGPAEVVKDGEDGRLVPVGDWLALAGVLKSLCEDQESRNLLSGRGRRSVERFRSEPILRRYQEAILG